MFFDILLFVALVAGITWIILEHRDRVRTQQALRGLDDARVSRGNKENTGG